MRSFCHSLCIAALLMPFLLITSCGGGANKVQDPNNVEITAKEVIQAQNYTYVLADNGDSTYWVAIPSAAIETGKTYYHAPGMLMVNFESKDLQRTFDRIWFLGGLSEQPIVAPAAAEAPHGMPESGTMTGSKVKTEAAAVSVKPAEGGVTVAQIFADPAKYAGKKVLIRAQVIKVNNEIMDRNWVHLQDGTEHEGRYDLVITTDEFHEVGAVVTFEGVVTVNKDFGAGYVYEVILEEGKARINM
ncbi:MAG TPA: hypothetical protein P5550_05520 [Bacteroidales bacterium]|nr:hypothetical protein [Bacteroidales bacterium]